MSKYEPLSQTLTRLKADYWRPTFLELERILESKLPASARKNDIWWKAEAGGRHTHAHAWSAAGWKVQDVNVDKEKVTFVRDGAPMEDGEDEASRLAEAWRDRANQAREWGLEQRDAAAERLKEHPLAAVGVSAAVAFGVGIALGYLLTSRSEPEPEPQPVYGSRAEELARRALDAFSSRRDAYGGRAEELAKRALGGLTARVHELEDVVRERIERLRA
jgi:hypothetical protein